MVRRLGLRGAGGRRTPGDLGLRALVGPIARPQRGRLVAISVSSIVSGFAEAAMLVVVARVAFVLASGDDSVSFTPPIVGRITLTVTEMLLAASVLIAVKLALQATGSLLTAHMTAEAQLAKRQRLTHLLLNASWTLQSTARAGRAQELINGYAQGAGVALGALSGLLVAAFSLTAMLVAAVAVSPVASLAAAGAALAIGLMLRPLRAAVRRRAGRRADARLQLGTSISEFSAALQETRIFAVGEQVEQRIGALASTLCRRDVQSAYLQAVIPVVYQGSAMFLIIGALAIVYASGATGLGSVGAVVLIMIRSLTYAQAVQSSIQSLHAAAPLLEVLREEQERYRAAGVSLQGAPLDHVDTAAFDDVTFAYIPGRPVLRDMSFDLRRGEIVGIVGPSGAGKSTLVQLLLRLRDPTIGRMLINGLEANGQSLDDWYNLVTFIPQDARLFAGSVTDNIRFFRQQVDPGAIERAAKLAHVHDDIVSWPEGYDTPVGERGGQLSGGEQQRLCIARALVGDPDLVVLDEPTSSLDARSEALMRDTIADLAPRKTVVVIAHRLSTLSICDRIMVIFNGRLEGFDDPATLEATNPFYREALQLAGMR
ncbi:MAG: ABC transporter ATP-binding protein [Acidimicrobiia bacterium]